MKKVFGTVNPKTQKSTEIIITVPCKTKVFIENV